jgi:hypothetical protein
LDRVELRFVISGLISALGLGCAAWYLIRAATRAGSSASEGKAAGSLGGHRPWRTLGAAICGLLAAAFFVGVNYLDARQSPGAYALFWILILLGVLWLCGLAFYDILYTRRQLRRALRAQIGRQDSSGA